MSYWIELTLAMTGSKADVRVDHIAFVASSDAIREGDRERIPPDARCVLFLAGAEDLVYVRETRDEVRALLGLRS